MPPVNWDVFAALPGSADDNFERLCRALVRLHYGQFGIFAARALQPGVEFHLKLHAACSLGQPGTWYGWQCRWYELGSGKPIGRTRRKKIEEAIRTTERHLPGLTDWVLWTRRPLTAGDQQWFYDIRTSVRKHLWTAEDVEHHLSGPAAILRGTYFGELVLTPAALQDVHERAVAPIRQRWRPEIHQRTGAERVVARVLGRPVEWQIAARAARRMRSESDARVAGTSGLPPELAVDVHALAQHGQTLAARLGETVAALTGGDVELLRADLNMLPPKVEAALRALPRRLRALRHPSALYVTNLLDSLSRGRDFLRYARMVLDTRVLAIVAGAGVGKTELAAQLSAPSADTPAGVLLHGRDLHGGGNLDDLARSVVIQGAPVASMEALVAAVNAAGQRAQRRLPIFIDGLNEAEDPRDWRAPLAALSVMMRQYANVVVICTIRPAFVNEAVPLEIPRVRLRGFAGDPLDAIRNYFRYYKIDSADAEVPVGLLRHPLTLRLFCEVTNSTRARVVGVEAMPGSLTALFERYLEQAGQRIAQLAPRTDRYMVPDVERALHVIGTILWETKARSLDFAALRQELGDAGRPWSGSLLRALEHEGVLIRVRGDTPASNHVAVVYDLLAGHIVAAARISRLGREGVRAWLADPATAEELSATAPTAHPLSEDILAALAGLLPRRIPAQQLWPLVDEPLRSPALYRAATLEGRYIDAETAEKIASLLTAGGEPARRLLDRLWQTRGSADHPLNAEYLDTALRAMTVAERDLIWTEWVRDNAEEISKDMVRLGERWRERLTRHDGDVLRAQWVMWVLTTTARDLRDEATRALYWFGRGAPEKLFALALSALEINDPYVGERTMAAAYGVVMAQQLHHASVEAALAPFLGGLAGALVGDAATTPTNHWLLREYVRGIFLLASRFYPAALPGGLVVVHTSFAVAPLPAGPPDAAARAEVNGTLHMDFENYTLGRLVEGRRNYDMEHQGHKAVLAHVEDTVWDLGWRSARFGEIDRRVGDDFAGRQRRRVERYGKKYGWVGFFTYAGLLAQKGRLPECGDRLSDVDLDPSFPEPPTPAPVEPPSWLIGGDVDERHWVTSAEISVPPSLIRTERIGNAEGPWVAVYGHLVANDRWRRVTGHLVALIVPAQQERDVAETLRREGYWNSSSAYDLPGDFYTFAGEIPWHPEFAGGEDAAGPDSLYRGALVVRRRSTPADCLAHTYSWESYHSTLNKAGGAVVPSRPFSARFGLRGVPQAFHQVLADGSLAALSLKAPKGFTGEILYVREALLDEFVGDRGVLWFMIGERQLSRYSYPIPEWLADIMQARQNEWRAVWRRTDLRGTSKPSRRKAD